MSIAPVVPVVHTMRTARAERRRQAGRRREAGLLLNLARRRRQTVARGRRRNPSLPPDLNAPAQRSRYYNILASMMEYINNRTYPSDKVFSAQELGVLKPEDIHRWMCWKIYGNPTPGNDAQPKMRSSTIQYWKKAISYFMPTDSGWNDAVEAGNPTKSKLINRLHKAVKKAETRGQGKPSRADRKFTDDEFDRALDLLGSNGSSAVVDRRRFQAMVKFQYHLIGRCDDTAHVKKEVIRESTQFAGHLVAQMRWSKNVTDERDCPNQLIMGSMNPKYCVELGLALFLEKWIGDGEGAISQWLFANGTTTRSDEVTDQDKEAASLKTAYSRYVTKAVLESPSFVKDGPGQLGTHSIRKIAVTNCRQRGCSKDECDYRARWKFSRRMQDTYTDTQLNWPDIKAGSKLCQGGVCKYKVKEGLGITDQWLATEICPNIAGAFDHRVAAILAKPLLWACFEPNVMTEVPNELYQTVCGKIRASNLNLEQGVNPIEKVELIPSQTDGNVDMDEVPLDEGEIAAGGGTFRRNQEMNVAVYAKVRRTAERVVEMQHLEVTEFAELKKRLIKLERMIHSLCVAPARIVGGGGRATTAAGAPIRVGIPAAPTDGQAVLCRGPKTLEVLWDEYVNGVGGNKPAREWTPRERGRKKSKATFSKRLRFWRCMTRLINGGCTVSVAIRRIHQVYGYGSITSILDKMQEHEGNGRGGHARLQA